MASPSVVIKKVEVTQMMHCTFCKEAESAQKKLITCTECFITYCHSASCQPRHFTIHASVCKEAEINHKIKDAATFLKGTVRSTKQILTGCMEGSVSQDEAISHMLHLRSSLTNIQETLSQKAAIVFSQKDPKK